MTALLWNNPHLFKTHQYPKSGAVSNGSKFLFFLYKKLLPLSSRLFSLSLSLSRAQQQRKNTQQLASKQASQTLDGLGLGLGACFATLVGPGEVGDWDDEEGVAAGAC